MSPLPTLSMLRLSSISLCPRGLPSFASAGCSKMRNMKCVRAFPCSTAPHIQIWSFLGRAA
eukprot:3631503-Pyramimonas_sp.AAC.1